MRWLYILIAAAFEVGWAVGLKYTDGLTKLWPSVFTLVGNLVSVYFLAQAVAPRPGDTFPIGSGYAIWTGIGAVGTALLGMLLFGESTNPARLACLALIVAGIVGLELTGGH